MRGRAASTALVEWLVSPAPRVRRRTDTCEDAAEGETQVLCSGTVRDFVRLNFNLAAQ